jgi:hypothetical protein
MEERRYARDAAMTVIYTSARDEGSELGVSARGWTVSGGNLVAASAHLDSAYPRLQTAISDPVARRSVYNWYGTLY